VIYDFRCTVPVLKIYSLHYVYYKFSVLAVYIGTRLILEANEKLVSIYY